MHATFKQISENHCTLTRLNPWSDEVEELEFWAPSPRGYVRFGVGTDKPQVCRDLGHRGSTLYWPGTHPLIEMIREEYRALRRNERRQLEAY